MQSSELPEDDRKDENREEGAKESRPLDDLAAVTGPDEVTDSLGESKAQSVSLEGSLAARESDTPAAGAPAPEIAVDGDAVSRALTPDETIDSSSSDQAVSPTTNAEVLATAGGDDTSTDEQSAFESAPSVGGLSGYTTASSAAASFVPDDGVTSSADLADAAADDDGSESRTVTESTADPWISQMMAIHPRGSSFYGPPDDIVAGGVAEPPDSTVEGPTKNKPFIGPLRSDDGEDPAEQWMRYYQAVHDAARNPRIYSNNGPIPSEDSLALPLALPVTLRHMTPLVERLIGRAAIEIHQVCEELVKYEIDQFKFELYTEMRALW